MSNASYGEAVVKQTSAALSMMSEEHQLEVLKKFVDSLEDNSFRNKLAVRFLGYIEGEYKQQKALRWMETYYRNHPGAKPMLVAMEYMLVAKISIWRQRLYKELSRRMYNRLKKREERQRKSDVSLQVSEEMIVLK